MKYFIDKIKSFFSSIRSALNSVYTYFFPPKSAPQKADFPNIFNQIKYPASPLNFGFTNIASILIAKPKPLLLLKDKPKEDKVINLNWRGKKRVFNI